MSPASSQCCTNMTSFLLWMGQVLLTLFSKRRTWRSIAAQCLEQGHTLREGGKMESGQGLFHLGPRTLCTGRSSLVWSVPWLLLWPQSWFQGFKGTRAVRVTNIRYHKRKNRYFSEAQPSPGFRLSNQNFPWFGPSFTRLQPGWLLSLLKYFTAGSTQIENHIHTDLFFPMRSSCCLPDAWVNCNTFRPLCSLWAFSSAIP